MFGVAIAVNHTNSVNLGMEKLPKHSRDSIQTHVKCVIYDFSLPSPSISGSISSSINKTYVGYC